MVETLVDPIMDRAFEEQAGEAAAIGLDQQLVAADVQEGLVLPGETRGRQVFGGRRTADGDAQIGTVLRLQLVIRVQNLLAQIAGYRCGGDQVVRAPGTVGEIADVAGLQSVEDAVECAPGAGSLENVPVGLRGDREPVRHAHAGGAQLAVHLSERGVLAADACHVARCDRPKRPDEPCLREAVKSRDGSNGGLHVPSLGPP